LTNSWLLTRGEKWKNTLASITGIENPDHFIKGTNTAALACVPFLMLGMYDVPVANCVDVEYLKDFYTSEEDKDAFYNTVTKYLQPKNLPRFKWIDRVKVPVMGLLSKLNLANDFKSEGHKMCAVSDIIVMLLCRDLYRVSASNPDGRKTLALDTLQKMAAEVRDPSTKEKTSCGFPAAQLALAIYFRQRGLKENNQEMLQQSINWATLARDNDYTTRSEKKYIAERHLTTSELTKEEQEEEKARAAEQETQKKAKRDEFSTKASGRVVRITPHAGKKPPRVEKINPRPIEDKVLVIKGPHPRELKGKSQGE